MKFRLPLLTSIAGLVLLTGCSTTAKKLQSYEQHLSMGNYAEAAKMTRELAEKKDGDEALWRLHSAKAEFLDGSNDAISTFDRAEDIFLENDKCSVFSKSSSTAWAMLTNDMAFDYNSMGQDRLFCSLYKAIDYIVTREPSAARTELNRAAQHQDNWLFERKKEIQDAADRLNQDADAMEQEKQSHTSNREDFVDKVMADNGFSATLKKECNFDTTTSGRLDRMPERDYMNAYITHFCGMYRWLNGDGGREYLRTALNLRPNHPVLRQDLQDINKGRPTNQVWIYVEDGLCPVREEFRLDLPTILIPVAGRYVMYTGIAFPRLKYRNTGATSYSIRAGGIQYQLTELENMDRLCKIEYDVYMRGAIAREVIRVLVKATIQAALGASADNTRDWGAVALRSAQIAFAGWCAGTTNADVRCWTALPKRILMTRITRPNNGNLILNADLTMTNIPVQEGNNLIWIRKTSVTAQPVVKILHFD